MKGLMVILVLMLGGVLALLLHSRHSAPPVDDLSGAPDASQASSLQVTPPAEGSERAAKPQVDSAAVPPAVSETPEPSESAAAGVARNEGRQVGAVTSLESVVEKPVEAPARALLGHRVTDQEVLDRDLQQAIERMDLKGYRELLKRSLVEASPQLLTDAEQDPFAKVWDQQVFYQTMLRWKLLETFPPVLWEQVADYPGFPQLVDWLFGNNRAMEEVLLTVQAEDDLNAAMLVLARLWGNSYIEDPKLAPKYFNLQLACALVFDHQLTYRTPLSSQDAMVDYEKRYAWYVKQNERGWLEASMDRSPARDLCFVVCAPIRDDELEWAVREYRGAKRKGWGKIYGEIEYLMERAVEGLDPYEEYTLEQIQKEGGICGDQTYFCVNTARAAGIPALGLSGMTDSGGHAWAAVKVDDDAWSTSIGRIGGVSMGKGTDPQTGGSVTEQDIWMWSSREHHSRTRVLQVYRHLWLADLLGLAGDEAKQELAVRWAHRFGKAFPVTWERFYQVLQKDPLYLQNPDQPATVGRWKDFVAEIKREFKENPRMGTLSGAIRDKHVFPYLEINEARKELARDRRRFNREAAEQVDLVTDSLSREASLLSEKDPLNASREIHQLYDGALRDYGGSISGFRSMADDYFKRLKGDKEYAGKTVRAIELAFKRMVDQGSKDYFRVQAETGLHRRIAEMYRQIGEEKRADLLLKRLERDMAKAKRDAL